MTLMTMFLLLTCKLTMTLTKDTANTSWQHSNNKHQISQTQQEFQEQFHSDKNITSLKWLTVAMPFLKIRERLARDKRDKSETREDGAMAYCLTLTNEIASKS